MGYQLTQILKRVGQKNNLMFIGEIITIDDKYFVNLPSAPTKNKIYPVSTQSAEFVLERQGSNRTVDVNLIPIHKESDEQPEYLAFIQYSFPIY